MTTFDFEKLPSAEDYLNGEVDSYQWDKYVSASINMVLSWVDTEYNEAITMLTNKFRGQALMLYTINKLQQLMNELEAIDQYLAKAIYNTRIAFRQEETELPFNFYYTERLRRYVSGELLCKIDSLLGEIQKQYQDYKKEFPHYNHPLEQSFKIGYNRN